MSDRELGLTLSAITFLASTLYLQWAFYGLLKRLEAMELSVLNEMKVRQANDERMSERLFSIADHIKVNLENLNKQEGAGNE